MDSPGASQLQPLAVRARHVWKRYGRVIALKNVELDLRPNRTLGLSGDNGAGKSTALAILAGFVVPSEGEVRVLGERPGGLQGRVGALVGASSFPQNARVGSFLLYLAKLQLLAQPAHEVDVALERVEGTSWSKLRFRDLSREKQRLLGVAQAFMGRPQLVLLDEPTEGLDRRGIELARRILEEHRGKVAIVVSSHRPEELADACDDMVAMEDGRVVSLRSCESIRTPRDDAGASPLEAGAETHRSWAETA